MGGSCGLVLGILVLILAVTGTQAQCTEQELTELIKCILPYDKTFLEKFGRGCSCDRTLISGDVCDDFNAIVVCTNKKSVSNETCRPHAACQISKKMEIPCKIAEFVEECKNATPIDKGGEASVGISLGLLGAVIIVSLIALM